jgi:hypothetical protein
VKPLQLEFKGSFDPLFLLNLEIEDGCIFLKVIEALCWKELVRIERGWTFQLFCTYAMLAKLVRNS